MKGSPAALLCTLCLGKLLVLSLGIEALGSTWAGCLAPSLCKLHADQCCKFAPAVAACWGGTKLGAVGAAVVVAGCCSTSKLGYCALSSSKDCTIAFSLEAVLLLSAAVVAAAGVGCTSKLGLCALASSICRTIAVF